MIGEAEPTVSQFRSKLKQPVFVISTPRSGSTLLFQTLIQSPDAYSIFGESHQLIEGMEGLHPRSRGWSSNRLTEEDATPHRIEELSERFYARLTDREGNPPDGAVRMIEKTPKNSLRIPFFDRAYPDALFAYLYRDARQTLSSMLEAWITGRFRTYPDLPDWPGYPWSLLLVPGWRELRGLSLPEIVARQWATASKILLDDLSALPPERVRSVSYGDLVASPQATISTLCASLGLGWDDELGPALPLSVSTVSAPHPEKWRAVEAVIESVWPIVKEQDERAREFHESLARQPC